MTTPILDLEHQVWYTGYTGTNCFLDSFPDVLMSYNLDTLCTTIHPLEKDLIGFKTMKLPMPPQLKAPFTFVLPVIDESFFFNRTSFVNPQGTLRRARHVQMLGYKIFNSRKVERTCRP